MRAANFSSIRDAVAEFASTRTEILAAYVFGSVATARTRKDSDVDVAVLLRDGMRSSRMFDYRLELLAGIASALHRPDVDIVILNGAPPLLAHRILSKGKLVFERSASARVRFQVMTANRYADMVPAFETYIRYLKKSVREGRIIG
jgi:predicted nucleotidyltransferase